MKTLELMTVSALMCISVFSCGFGNSAPKGEFIIEGQLTNVPDSSVITAMEYDSSRIIMKDTIIGGHFMLHDTMTVSGARKISIIPSGKGFPGMRFDIWVAAGTKTGIRGSDCLMYTWDIRSRVPEQKQANAMNAAGFPERGKMLEYIVKRDSMYRSGNRKAYSREIDSLGKLIYALDSIVRVRELQYMETAPVTDMWIDKYLQLASILQWQPDYAHNGMIRSLYSRMSESDLNTAKGKKISAYMNLPAAVEVGDNMADGDLYDTEGNIRHLSEFIGKYILLDFWSRGCGPCIRSIPELEEVAGLYSDRMAVVSISQDPENIWKSYIKDKKLKGNQWNGLNEGIGGLEAAYQVHGIPHYVLISPEGKVAAMWSGYAEGYLKAKVREYIR